MFGTRCASRLTPLLPQLRDVCGKSQKSSGSTFLLKLSPCQACYVRKLSNRFHQLHQKTKFTKQRSFTTTTSNYRTDNNTGTNNSNNSTNTSTNNNSASSVIKPVSTGSGNDDDCDRGSTLEAVSRAQLGEKVAVFGKASADEVPVLTTPAKSSSDKPLRKAKRSKIDWSAVYYANTYVTPIRALNEYMLISADLESLPKYTRRSPFVGVGNMSVYLKHDIEQKAYEVWNGKENFLKEKERRRKDQEAGDITASLFKKAVKQYRRTNRKSEFDRPKPYEADLRNTSNVPRHANLLKQTLNPPLQAEFDQHKSMGSVFKSGTGKVVLYAIAINFANFLLKLVAWLYTGSHSMFAEAIHSAADTCNQCILAVGIHQSIKLPDREHPYGYDNLRYVSSLISGVGIFCIGAGLSWYHGIQGLLHPDEVESLYWAIAILGGSLISEGATLVLAWNQARASAVREGLSVLQYVREGYEPSTNVVLLEDLAAVMGVLVAGGCMAATALTGNVLWDATGSIVIGSLLAAVASFIIYTNSQALVGRSIPYYQTARMCQLLESDRMVRALHDVKATDMGGKFVRFKAEVDFDGKELTRSYLDKVDIDSLLLEMRSQQTIEEVEEFMLRHGEKIVDALGMEVDRLEQKIIKNFPKVRHVDLEIL